MKPAEPNRHQLRACTVSAGGSAGDAETPCEAPANSGAVSADMHSVSWLKGLDLALDVEIRPDHITEDALAQTCEGLRQALAAAHNRITELEAQLEEARSQYHD